MEIDASTNYLTFRLTDGREVTGSGPVRDEDVLRDVWAGTAARWGLAPADVAALHCWWEPSARDLAFARERFPQLAVAHDVRRPAPDEWDHAIASLAGTVSIAAQVRAEREDPAAPRLQPVLRSVSRYDPTWEHVECREVVPGALTVSPATVWLADGQVQMSHLGGDQGWDLDDLLGEAGDNLLQGLRGCLTTHEGPDGGTVLSLEREGFLAASAIAFPEMRDAFGRALGTDRVVFGLPDAGRVWIARAGSRSAADIRDRTLGSGQASDLLLPSVVLSTPDGMRLLAERPPEPASSR